MPALALLASADAHAVAPPVWSVLPFVLTLLGIAVLPLVTPHRWESNRFRAGFTWSIALPTALWWLATFGSGHLLHAGREYLSFIVLLGSLYVASGGIYLRGAMGGTPVANAGICAVGAVIANLIGTTGASMLLIRPFLRANAHRSMRSRAIGVVFFIFCVSNIGGCLTPLGDPPLFLGFLRGVPFQWPFLHLVPEWATAVAIVLVIYLVVDRRLAVSDPAKPPGGGGGRFGVDGLRNGLVLLGVIGVVLGQGLRGWPFGVQEGAMAALAVLSLLVTPKPVREANRFTFGPILEVAILFSGIFTTMVPALAILDARGGELGLTEPWHYFWATGMLSSFLDNAPTYLTLGTTAAASLGLSGDGAIGILAHGGVAAQALLSAVSCGAVFMGANTYIGNGPNFMVRAIAVENGVAMPSFFGYMKYSGMILIPVFALLTFLFFRS